LEKALKGQPFALRGYSADPVLTYTWANNSLSRQPVHVHTLGLFTTQSVKLVDRTVMIQGFRETITGSDKNHKWQTTKKTPMTIKVELGDADTALAMSILQDSLFYSDVDSAVQNLPDAVAQILPYNSQTKPKLFDRTATSPDAPVLVSAPPKPADPGKHAGAEIFTCMVAADGTLQDIWLDSGVGGTEDDSAAAALQTYQFKPAQAGGQPVPVYITIDVAAI
jgi:hypothetical protein